MHTVKLNIDDKIYDKILCFLNEFGKDELEIIVEDVNFLENKKYLETELQETKEGKGSYYTIEEVEKRLDKIIEKHENNL